MCVSFPPVKAKITGNNSVFPGMTFPPSGAPQPVERLGKQSKRGAGKATPAGLAFRKLVSVRLVTLHNSALPC